MEKLSPAMEDYLKTIYGIGEFASRNPIRISDIAARMGKSKASACYATKTLQGKGLLTKSKYATVHLTDAGARQAEFILKRNSVVSRFLKEVLKVADRTAETDACGIEHVISFECYQSISHYLDTGAEN
ncbi:MAG: metal-dependent transcriptional regulator [Acidaminococcales bacterium]|nr:metal-dependent transcriptional regulator [Acidaminococcales bacterium]